MNRLIVHVQPAESISIKLGAKIPGRAVNIGRVSTRVAYAGWDFSGFIGTGYKRLLTLEIVLALDVPALMTAPRGLDSRLQGRKLKPA